MWKNFTSLHTPLNIEKLKARFDSKKKIGTVDLVLIIVGVITTIVLVALLVMLFQKQGGL